jgi:cytochrome c oxidase subunit 2
MMQKWLHFFGLPENISAHGGQLDDMLGLVHWLMLILFVGWGIYFLYVLGRFRAGNHPRADYTGVKNHVSSYLEVMVAVVEVVLLVGFAFPMWALTKTSSPVLTPDTVQVHVIAQQFAWNVHYPGPDGVFGRRDIALVNEAANPIGLDCGDPAAADDVVTINHLYLPVNRPAMVQLTTKDVIHSFSLPELRVKQDAVPGLDIPVWFTPVKTAEHEIACAQLCGLGHYRMRGYLHIVPEEEFAAKLAEQGLFCAE